MPTRRQFLFVSTTSDGGPKDEARVSHPRVAVIAKKRSAAKFVQSYVDVGASSSSGSWFYGLA